MAILQLEVSREKLLEAVEQLEPEEFAIFVEDVLQVKARRSAPALNETEEDLLKQIHALQLPDNEHERLLMLGQKLENEAISSEELSEMKYLSERSEQLNAKRIKLVSELATMWKRSLPDVMQQLGLWQAYGN